VSPSGEPASSGATRSGLSSIVLHSSWTGIVMSTGGAVLLTALAVYALVAVGVTVVSAALGMAAVIAIAVVVLDMPIAARFDDEGVTRRALLRHHHISWEHVDRLSRMRRGWFRSSKMAPTGGLIAVRGRRNIALVDRMEGHVEHRHLRVALGDVGERLGVDRIATPPLDQPPTWLHRRARWTPDGTGQR
jgi:hypothetical protein